MTQKEINELKKRCYAIGNSKFPLDQFFNDIRINDNPKYNKKEAYKDLKLIVDEIYRLREKQKEPTYTLEEVKQMWEELGYEWFDRKKENYVELRNEEKEEIIIIDYEKKRYAKSDTRVKWVLYITYQEHQLLTKTIKMLERKKENVCS